MLSTLVCSRLYDTSRGSRTACTPEKKADITITNMYTQVIKEWRIKRTPKICLTDLSAKRSLRKASASQLALKRSWNLNWKKDKPASRFLYARHIMDGDG